MFDRSGQRFTTSTENVAAKKDFNRVEIEGHPPDVFEKAFAASEAEIAPALSRIIETESLQDVEDRKYLFNLIAMMSVHQPLLREQIREYHERASKMMLELALKTPERWASQVKKARAAGYMTDPSANDYEAMKDFLKRGEYKFELRNEYQIKLALKGMESVLPLLFERKWHLLKARKATGGFITSDHPVCLLWMDQKLADGPYGPGFGLKSTAVVFPISNRLAVTGAFEFQEEIREIDAHEIARMNGHIINCAGRQVYSRDFNFTCNLQANDRQASKLASDPLFRQSRRAEY